MRRMGGLARRLPFTFGVFLLATLALCGVPPFAGFFSKDEILWTAWSAAGGSPWLWAVGSLASFLTAFYMFRAIFMTFFGNTRVSAELQHHIHEPPLSMSAVLAVLAFGSVVAGFIGLPQFWREWLGVSAPFYDFLAPVLGHAHPREGIAHSAEWVLMLVAVAVALAGIVLAWLRYGRPGAGHTAAPQSALQRLVAKGYYLDDLYDRFFVRGLGWLSVSVLSRRIENPLSSGSTIAPAEGARAGTRWLGRWQTGDLQAYVLYALIGLVAMLTWGVTRV
jgi:NADH-quinone oxidoreductase subunit L